MDDCTALSRYSAGQGAGESPRTVNLKTCTQNNKEVGRCGHMVGHDAPNCLIVPMCPA